MMPLALVLLGEGVGHLLHLLLADQGSCLRASRPVINFGLSAATGKSAGESEFERWY